MASGTDPAWGWGLVDQDGTVWHSGPGAASSSPANRQADTSKVTFVGKVHSFLLPSFYH